MTALSRPEHYFVVYTQNNAERRAYDALRNGYHEPYWPRIKARRAHAGRVDWVHRSFLPRYMFVPDQFNGVSLVKRTDGVHDVVRAGMEPVRIRSSVVDGIRAREIDGFVQLDAPLVKTFRPGQLLRINQGDFDGRDAIFQQMSGETRALVFLEAVIGRVEARIPVVALEAIRVERPAA